MLLTRSFFLVVFLLFSVSGCGSAPSDRPDLGTVTGKVTAGGQPVADVIVTFTPAAGGRPSSGKTGSDGSYSLMYAEDAAGAAVGSHSVRLAVAAPDVQNYEAENADSDNSDKEVFDDKGLPKEAFDGSITKDVKAGANEINIEL